MYLLIICLPFMGSAFSGLLGHKLGAFGAIRITTYCIIFTFLLSCFAFYEVALAGSPCYFEFFKGIFLVGNKGFKVVKSGNDNTNLEGDPKGPQKPFKIWLKKISIVISLFIISPVILYWWDFFKLGLVWEAVLSALFWMLLFAPFIIYRFLKDVIIFRDFYPDFWKIYIWHAKYTVIIIFIGLVIFFLFFGIPT